MLAGLGPVPAVLFVVAADDPWMPQASRAPRRAGRPRRRHGSSPSPAATSPTPRPPPPRRRRRLAAPVVGEVPRRAGQRPHGRRASTSCARALAELRAAALPAPDPDADVRLWVDRRFTVRGAGTVVTGTLPAGTVPGRHPSAGRRPPGAWASVAGGGGRPMSRHRRVALNLTGDVDGTRGARRADDPRRVAPDRGAGRTPHRRCRRAGPPRHRSCTSGRRLAVRHRPLDGGSPGSRSSARCRCGWATGCCCGTRGRRLWRARPRPDPPRLRRGARPSGAAEALEGVAEEPDLASEVARREVVDVDTLRRIGVPEFGCHRVGGARRASG